MKWTSPEYRSAVTTLLGAMKKSIFACMLLGGFMTGFAYLQCFGALLNMDGFSSLLIIAATWLIMSCLCFSVLLLNRYKMHKNYGHLPMGKEDGMHKAMETLIKGPSMLRQADSVYQDHQSKREAQSGNLSISVDSTQQGGDLEVIAASQGMLTDAEDVRFCFDVEFNDEDRSTEQTQENTKEDVPSSVVSGQYDHKL